MSFSKNFKSKNQIESEITQFKRELPNETVNILKLLKKQNLMQVLNSICIDWGIICFNIYLVNTSIFFIPIALIFIGSRQRALSNLVHDASHGNLANQQKLNDILANLFAAWPMFDSVSHYRFSHLKHHQFLGCPSLDPDIENHRRYGFYDFKLQQGHVFKTYFSILLNYEAWKDSVIGSAKNLKLYQVLKISFLWLSVMTIISQFNVNLALLAFVMWWLSRMTTYHCIRIFAEFLDHSGLEARSVFSYTRNISGASKFLVFLIHPHSDNFHLVHHLFPQVPHFRLKQVHLILMENKRYQKSCNCDGYFFGSYTAWKSWKYGWNPL